MSTDRRNLSCFHVVNPTCPERSRRNITCAEVALVRTWCAFIRSGQHTPRVRARLMQCALRAAGPGVSSEAQTSILRDQQIFFNSSFELPTPVPGVKLILWHVRMCMHGDEIPVLCSSIAKVPCARDLWSRQISIKCLFPAGHFRCILSARTCLALSDGAAATTTARLSPSPSFSPSARVQPSNRLVARRRVRPECSPWRGPRKGCY
jgi:hypothetical protein